MNCTSLQELGQRANQEDAIFPALGAEKVNDRLFMVCDGMGGYERGEVASQIVCDTFSKALLPLIDAEQTVSEADVLSALEQTYAIMDTHAVGKAQNMGTTLTLLALSDTGATIAHLGDSRVYHIRPTTRELLYRTRDHSLVYDLFEAGLITEREMEVHPQRNVITRAIMPGEDRRTSPTVFLQTDVQNGDYFYLCSDGMLECVPDTLLLDILMRDITDQDKIEFLREASKGAKDNHTAHLVRISLSSGMSRNLMKDDEEEKASFKEENTVAEHTTQKIEILRFVNGKTLKYSVIALLVVLLALSIYMIFPLLKHVVGLELI